MTAIRQLLARLREKHDREQASKSVPEPDLLLDAAEAELVGIEKEITYGEAEEEGERPAPAEEIRVEVPDVLPVAGEGERGGEESSEGHQGEREHGVLETDGAAGGEDTA
jgi:hypothetical protein